jgi:hypothetical protein
MKAPEESPSKKKVIQLAGFMRWGFPPRRQRICRGSSVLVMKSLARVARITD